jgi:sensor histidine kinase YesM
LIIFQVLFTSVFASSPQPPFTESDYSDAVSLSINNANTTIDEIIQAVRDNNSTETLQLLSELRSDLADINGNVTDLIFSVAAQPP